MSFSGSRARSNDELLQQREQRRLLGNRRGRDPNAIPINIPGSVKVSGSFRPINTLRQTSELASFTNPISNLSRPSFTHPGSHRPDVIYDVVEKEDTPPRKKLKTDTMDIIDLEDDSDQLPCERPVVVLPSPSKKQLPKPNTPKKQLRLPRTAEYLDAPLQEKIPQDTGQDKWVGRLGDVPTSFDPENEPFTQRVADRRAKSTVHVCSSKITASSKPARIENGTEEQDIQPITEEPKQRRPSSSSNAQKDGENHCLGLSDSSDELQGGKTTKDTWKQRAEPTRKSSPSNPRHIRFLSPSSEALTSHYFAQSKNSNKKLKRTAFRVRMFCRGDFIDNSPSELTFDRKHSSFFLVRNNTAIEPNQYNLMQAIALDYDDGFESNKVRLKFPAAHKEEGPRDVSIEFTDANETRRFCSFFMAEARAVRARPRKSEWMEKAFQSIPSPSKNPGRLGESKQLLIASQPHSHDVQPKRVKLADGLQNSPNSCPPSAAISQQSRPGILSRPTRYSPSISVSERLSGANPSSDEKESFVSIPIKKYNPIEPMRETRSRTRKGTQKDNLISSSSESEEYEKLPTEKLIKNRWVEPLVYPKIGKRKAEVHLHDLDRLKPSEFLNDNLVGFYIRFLEHHLEQTRPALAQRIYFFNSYFFATLKNSPKGQKGINYQGVQKWTRNVDIFSFDYVVVPINENAHWYVAIICNLPALLTPREVEVNEGEGQSPTKVKDNQVLASLDSMMLADGNEPSFSNSSRPDERNGSPGGSENEWPPVDETPGSTIVRPFEGHKSNGEPAPETQHQGHADKPKKKRGQKRPPPVQRYDVNQPVICVFDSLSLPRSPTTKILRDYLQEEAKSKRNENIDSGVVKGSNVKQIPQQTNYSDCGLYLLAYLEKFVEDPDTFMRKVLRKEMDVARDWPVMKPGLFRRRLYSFLSDLYIEQSDKDIEQKGGSLLVDRKPLCILLDKTLAPGEASSHSQSTEAPNRDKERYTTPAPGQGSVRKEKHKHSLDVPPITPTRSSPRFAKKGPRDKQRSSPLTITPAKPSAISTPIFEDIHDFLAKNETDPGYSEWSEILEVPETPP
ncbi:hypothetical protein FQN57_004824 [Myotisia sp. PD_48]|nr:hypothetical protein FQN57_004824 [Myotisia sp. PD_48]